LITGRASSIAIENPTLSADAAHAPAVSMPTTCPDASTSGTARVPRVDRRVGLQRADEVFDGRFTLNRHASIQTGDDAACHRHTEVEGESDRIDGVGERELARSPQRRGVEPGGVDLDDGDIVLWVRSDDGSAHCRITVRKHDANLNGTLYDVIVGHDHAVRRDDDAAPLGLGFPDLVARRRADLHDAHVDDGG
jgi:hypothetical protein